MEPDLSLIYNSQADNGILGIGWSLGGLSIVHRCPQTLAQDSTKGGINFDADDRFCLDGQRLIAITGAYGADGTEYRTEIDSFSRVISHGTAGSGPAYFTVETKAGQTFEYGGTTDSRVSIVGRDEARFWALNRVEDTVGNYMTLTYLEDAPNQTCRLDRIDYAGNTAAGTLPQSSVQFLYEVRPDQRDAYQAGARINMMHRLTSVQISTDASLVRDYRFAYDTSPGTGRSRLLSVTECDSSGNCLVPTEFAWSASGSPISFSALTPNPVTTFKGGQIHVGDFSGDGVDDFMLYDHDASTGSNGFNKWYINDGSGSFAEYVNPITPGPISLSQVRFGDWNGDGTQDVLFYDARHSGDGNVHMFVHDGLGGFTALTPNPVTTFKGGEVHVADLNADGVDDFMLYDHDASTGSNGFNKWYINDGSGSFTEYVNPITPGPISLSQVRFGDWNGDGTQDVLFYDARHSGDGNVHMFVHDGLGGFTALTPNPVTTFKGGEIHVGDFTNDGVDDFMLYDHDASTGSNGFNKWYINDGSGSFAEYVNPITPGPISLSQVRFGDWNGDGIQDVLFYDARHSGDGNVHMFVHDGLGGFTALTPNPVVTFKGGEVHVADLNADGADDFMLYDHDASTGSNGRNKWYINDGSGSFSEYVDPIARGPISLSRVNFGDWNGDGIRDVLFYDARHSGDGNVHAFNNELGPDLLTTVTDSLGRNTTITYAPLTDPSVYAKGTGAVFPELDVQGPLYVVQEVSSDDGLGGQARTTYSYEGARAHVQGRGFLGFARMTAVDQQTGIETITDYRQDFPFVGRVAATETRLADSTKVKTVSDTWDEKSLNGGLTRFPFVSQSQAESFEINDGPGNLPITTITTTSVYDDFGNPTSIVATTVGGGKSFTKTTTNTYTNDTVNWFLGRLTRATVKSELPDLSFETRVSAFDYNATTGLLTQEVIEPDLPAFRLTTDYGHDAFGNVTSQTVSGGDITTRTTTTEFSADGRFATKVTNDLGHVETHAHDTRFGLVTSLTGPNLITTTWDYDGFARKTREARADGTETTWSYDLCTTQCPAGGVYAVVQQDLSSAAQTPIGPRSVEYFDALNRAFRSETEGFDGTKIFVDTEFNARGETVAVTRPYFEGTGAIDIQKVTSTYDDIGRALSVTQPDGGVTTTIYAGLTTTSTNALNQTETRLSNAIGQLIEATDNLGTKVTYKHDPLGNLEETDAGGVVTIMDHDIRGRKASMNDPDMGVWTYGYNVLGELVSQTDAKLQSVTLEYDTLGRLKRRIEPEGTTEWVYDTAAKGIGKLHSVTAPGGYLQTQSYDSLGRPSATTTTIDGVNYTSSVTYDGAGRVETQVYPSGFTLRNTYNARGYLASVMEDGGSTVYWQADSVNAEGQVTQATLGNGVVSSRAYDPKTGLIDSIATSLGATTIQDLVYDFDKLGNLKQRADLRQDRQEDFLYDGLNRLTTTTLTNTGAGGGTLATTTATYDVLGNIQTKSDVGSYTYGGGGAGPHAVTAAGADSYGYDDNGSMTSGAGRTITYASFNKPTLIRETASGDEAGFVYGPDRARIKQHIVEGGVARDVVYVGAYERRTRFGSPDELVHYISAGGTVAIHTIYDDNLPATDKARYLHRDHLGSIEAITGETGAVVERLSFDAHGKRRLADWTAGDPVSPDAETPRGFTGHEHLDSVGLIHMNGRVYDPTLGRFLSADPNVQAPDETQSYNRYSYVGNNPLSFTDPSGFFFKKIGKFLKNAGRAIFNINKAIVEWNWKIRREVLQNQWARLAITVFVGVAVPGVGGILASAALAGLATVANGGSLTDGLIAAGIAAGTAGAFYGVGEAFSAIPAGAISPVARHVAKTVAHGVVGGISSRLQGGKFHHGFAAAGVAQLAAPAIGALNSIPGPQGVVARAALAATAGGVGAELGGGKYKNGAITGAYAYLFNEAAHRLKQLAQNAEQPRARPTGRVPGNVYVTGHRVGGIGPTHLAIEHVPLDGSGESWISAGPEDGLLVSGVDGQRPTDAPENNVTIGLIRPPMGISATHYYNSLLSIDSNYCDCLDYDLFPGLSNSYNSNSFVSGLVRASGGSVSFDFGEYTGGQKPLPPAYFSD